MAAASKALQVEQVDTFESQRYPRELLLRVVTLSIDTMKIANALRELDI